ncbi:MAG: hypothetical protein RBQ77_00570 [Candidatus Methanomethylophilaceae archaeon]|nr:hypothetical protein [Candidatus Methanomethylophilaceae archaeon]NLF33363.1 hypothetical protein [Thermoplasmatales archaeon]
MKSLEERFEEIQNDPVKKARAFKMIWIVSYGMLMLGAFIIVYVLLTEGL